MNWIDRIGVFLLWLALVAWLVFCSCQSPRYDYNGNGTSLCDRAAMSLGTFVNKQRPPFSV